MSERIEKQFGIVAPIESKRHFVEIRGKMLCADIVPSTHDPALQERERGFDGIGVNQAGDIFLLVANRLVRLLVLGSEAKGVDVRFVCDNHVHVLAQVFVDDLAHALGIRVFHVDESQFAIPFADSENYLFRLAWEPATSLPAHISFVNFDRAINDRFRFLHRSSDSVAEVPSCLVTPNSNSALNLAGRHPFLRLTQEHGCQKPFSEWQVRMIEHCASGYAKLIPAVGNIQICFL